jgi:hypothetical protein
MSRYVKLFISILCVCGAFIYAPILGYFEERYRCVIESEIIQVSLATWDKLCLDYLAGLSTLIANASEDLTIALKNKDLTSWYDRDYRIEQSEQLYKKKTLLLETQENVLLAVKDFEKELFIRVKSVVWYYLFPYTVKIKEKLLQWVKLQHRLLVLWNSEQLVFVRHQMDLWERELLFLERIQQSIDFNTLMPSLKRWFALQETQKF